jgi:DNA polymerase III epsilon subunit-like protein
MDVTFALSLDLSRTIDANTDRAVARGAAQEIAAKPTKLPDACRQLGIQLNHHDALSDAEAWAQIVISAAQDGAEIRVPRTKTT